MNQHVFRWSKLSFFREFIKETVFLTIRSFVLYLFSAKDVCNAIFDLVLYLLSEGLNISSIYSGTTPFQSLKTISTIQYSTLSLAMRQFIFLKWNGLIQDLREKINCFELNYFELFGFQFSNFSLKEETMKCIHNWNVAELEDSIIVF